MTDRGESSIARTPSQLVQPHWPELVYKRYGYYTVIEFEFDFSKSQRNQEKHGIDFFEAQELWDDPNFVEVPGRIVDEPRFMIIGRLDTSHWSAVVSYRNGKVRIISVRRSRKKEVALYESNRFRQEVR